MNCIGELHCIGTCAAGQKKSALGNLQIPNKYPFFKIFIWYLQKERGEIVKMVCRTHKYPPKATARMRWPRAGTRIGTMGSCPPLNAARRAE